jgi:predicted dienelactone hydrolase
VACLHGLTLIRDEWPLALLSINHALLHHVDRLHCAVQISADATLEGVQRLRTHWGERLTVVEIRTPAFLQEAITSALAAAVVAEADDRDWLYVFDADEFAVTPAGIPLRQLLLARPPELAELRYRIWNWIAPTDFDDHDLRSYPRLRHRALPCVFLPLPPAELAAEIGRGFVNYFDLCFVDKSLFRIAALRDRWIASSRPRISPSSTAGRARCCSNSRPETGWRPSGAPIRSGPGRAPEPRAPPASRSAICSPSPSPSPCLTPPSPPKSTAIHPAGGAVPASHPPAAESGDAAVPPSAATGMKPSALPFPTRGPRSMSLLSFLRRSWLACLLSAAAPLAPAAALERVQLQLPLLQLSFEVKLSELGDPERLLQGTSDLAEIDRATDGALGRRISELFATPLPVSTQELVRNSASTPMFEQVLLLASTLGSIDGVPADLNGGEITAALQKASASGDVTIQTVLEALPGQSATVDLEKALVGLRRLRNQFQPAHELLARLGAVPVDAVGLVPGPLPTLRSTGQLTVKHRSVPLQIVVIRPERQANGRLVVISHGLWDGPPSFEGWAQHLASHGYGVVLPLHPGSDSSQQRAMLSGKVPPPGPQELRLRPLDVSAVIDAVGSGGVAGLAGVDNRRAVVIGHSWGATTAMQLAGVTPSSRRLRERCENANDPERNLSWVLQCSFLDSADRAALADPRVVAVAAVSPPLNLIFDHGSGKGMNARALLITGSRDWVVPSGPEAINRFHYPALEGHQLVLANGGDHFNLRGVGDGGPLRALLLRWVDAAYAAGPTLPPAAGAPPILPAAGWGNGEIPLVLVPSDAFKP